MTDVTTKQLDDLADQIREADKKHEDLKRLKSEAYGELEQLKEEFMTLLDKAGKTSYKAEGIGSLTKIEKITVTTPKTHDEKASVFKWLRDELGPEGFLQYATVNHNSINSLYKTMIEEHGKDPAMFRIPGCGDPKLFESLRFRKG